jgi:hypothetical protein
MPADASRTSTGKATATRVLACVIGLAVIATIAVADREATLRAARRALSRQESPAAHPDPLGPGAFVAVQVGVALLVLVATMACVRWEEAIGARLASAWEHVRQGLRAFQRLPLIERLAWTLMIGAFSAQRLFDALTAPMHCDELRTFFRTVAHGPGVAATLYSNPNNPVLHSVLASVTVLLPLPPPLDLRLPAVLAAIAAVAAAALWLRRSGGPLAAVLGVATLTAMYPVVYYGTVARGYSLCLCAGVLGAWATSRLVERDERAAWRALFVLSCGLGAVAIPTHVYCVGALVLVRSGFALVDRSPRSLSAAWIDGVLAGVVAVVGYAGIFLRDGISAVTGNRFVRSRDPISVLERLPRHLDRAGRWMLDSELGAWFVPATVLVAAVLLWRVPRGERRLRGLAAIALAFALSIVVFPLLQRVIPLARRWVHVALAPALCVFVATSLLRTAAKPLRAPFAVLGVAAVVVSGTLGSVSIRHRNRADATLAEIDAWLAASSMSDVFAASRRAANSLRYHGLAAGHSRRLDDSRRWNPVAPERAYAALADREPPEAIVSELTVPPPPGMPGGFRLAREFGDFGVWVRER